MNYETLTEIKKEYLELIRIANKNNKLLDSLYYQRQLREIELELEKFEKKKKKPSQRDRLGYY